MSKSATTTVTFPIAGILGVVFVTLKLCHVIDWSWWWVTAPFWIGFAIVAAVFIVMGLVALVSIFFGGR